MFTSQTSKNIGILDEALQDVLHPGDVGTVKEAWASAGKKVGLIMASNATIYGIRTAFFLALSAGAGLVAAAAGRGGPSDPDEEETKLDHLTLLLDKALGELPVWGQVMQGLRRAVVPTRREERRVKWGRAVLEVDAFKPLTDGVQTTDDAMTLYRRWQNMDATQKRNGLKRVLERGIRTAGGLGAGAVAPTDALLMVADPLYEALYERPVKVPSKAYTKALQLTSGIAPQGIDESWADFAARRAKHGREREAAAQWLTELKLPYYDLVQLVAKGARERGMEASGKRWNEIESQLGYYAKEE